MAAASAACWAPLQHEPVAASVGFRKPALVGLSTAFVPASCRATGTAQDT